MRASPLVLAITIGLGLSLPANDAANAATKVQAVTTSGIKTYIVTFEEAPLASFRGSDGKKSGMPKMLATSPSVTGEARLNLNSAATQNYRNFLTKKRNERLAIASQKLGRTLTPTFVYDAATHGFAAPMTEAEAAQLRAIPGVKRVQPEVLRRLMTDRGPTWIKADQIWAGGGTPAVAANKGEGIIIAMIDSGINYLHPSFAAAGTAGATYGETFTITNPKGNNVFLGRCAATAGICNNKLIGVWDYVAGGTGIAGNGEDRDGHGTHTAATTSGNPVKITFTGGVTPYAPTMSGVAPRANIIAYKACDDTGCPGSMTLASINRAILDGANVISYSIGGGPFDPYFSVDGSNDPSPDDDVEAFLAARNAGIVSSVAAGNDGPAPGTVGNPSNSPWVMSVAATTHDRALVNTLVLTGGNSPRPGGGSLFGSGSNANTVLGPTLLKKDATYPLCATGSDPDDNFTGISKPPTWVPGFNASRFVACERGFYARKAKSENIDQSSGTGMILYNQLSEGDSLVSDNYQIPTIHLSYTDGVALTNWMNVGSGHTGELLGASYSNLASAGDKLASFSGRGPVVPTGIIKPDISAPGVDIVAAGIGASCNASTGANCANSATTKASLSGTSMATPHVAGAMALLKKANPTWTPSQIISALTLTARPTVTVNGVVGTPHEQGAGQTDVSKAVRAGLYLNVTDAQFKASNVNTANTLNLPTLGNSNCFESCVLNRTFTDMVGGGSYTVVSSLPAGVTMTPTSASVSFTNGQAQSLGFTFNVVAASNLLGKWVYGSVTLQNTTPANGRPNLTLPVAIFSSPYSNSNNAITSISQTVTTERGFFDYSFTGIAALPNARFQAGDLVTPKVSTPSLAQDPSPSNPYNGFVTGLFTDTFTVPSSPVGGPITYKVKVKTSSAASQDVDLYVGIDSNGNGLPAEAEQVCASQGPNATEACEFNVTTGASPVSYWILAQNFTSASTGSSDLIRVESYQAPIQAGTTGTLTATGPGKTTSGAAFKSRIAWDDPSFLAGQSRVGYLLVQATSGSNSIEIPVELTRTGTTVEPFALTNNVERNVSLNGSAAQDKLFFVVPPHATSVTFTTTSASNVDLYVAKSAVADDPNVSVIPAAPARNLAQASATTASGNETITLSGAGLTPGRWYVTPVNTTGAAVNATVKANITAQSAPPAFLSGQYVNSSRDGHGMFIDFAGPIGNPDQWVTVWYTYLEDGTPTWYYTQAPVPTANGIWRAELLRVVWNGNAASATDVGDLIITETGASTITVSYNIDGKSGSENMARVGGGSCPSFNATNLDVSGHWYSPDKSGFGYSFIATGGGSPQEVMIPYIYDNLGFPRWIYGQKGFNSGVDTFSFQWFSGFAPTATKVSLTGTAAGSGTRTLATNNITNMSVNSTLTGLLSGTWAENRPVAQLSQRKSCQ